MAILSQYFFPELISTGQLLTELAEDLVELGCSVLVVAGQPTYYESSRVPEKMDHRGIRILRVANTQLAKNSVSGKVLNSATFFLGALRKSLALPRNAIALVVTNPPILLFVPYLLSFLRGQKYIILIHDVYPDIAVQLGYLGQGGVIFGLWEKLNRKVMQNAAAVIVIGRDMEKKVREKLNPREWKKIRVIPNWSDGDAIIPVEKEENPFLREIGLEPSTFIVQYSGNMGLSHDMETIVEAADLLRDLPVRFLFIGGGGKREKIGKMAADLGLMNVQFLPYQAKEKLRYSLACSDVSLVCLGDGVEGLSVPSKYYGILASGRPVIALMAECSEVAMSIRESGCGYVVSLGDPGALAEKIRYVFHNPDVAKEMGKKARESLERSYSRRLVAGKYLDLLREVSA
ncbi:MAG: glycosyltransferase family 4 protein [Planctomycetota bacterium]